MRVHSLAAVFGVLGCVVACSSSQAPDEHLGTTTQNIVGGQSDTTHEAVVAVGLAMGECSGTIIKTDPATGVGWVLAAGHCIALGGDAQVVIQGDDITSPSSLQYQAVSGVVEPGYDKNTVNSDHDFSIITIVGVDADTPTMPIPTSTTDGVKVGNSVTSIGYGATDGTAKNPSNVRKNVSMKISQLTSESGAGTTQVKADANTATTGNEGVPCEGDSGGPVVDSTGTVIAVHSYGDTGCAAYIVSDRVSSELTWINSQLAIEPANGCGLCQEKVYSGKYQCAQLESACLGDPACGAYNTCVQACTTQDAACEQSCLKANPLAEGPLNAISNCGCNVGCVTECKADASCLMVPKCGYALKAGACTTFTNASCCDELLAASADGVGFQCLATTGTYAGCASNAPYQKLLACQKTSSTCPGGMGSGPGTGTGTDTDGGAGDPGTGNGATPGTTTTTKSGCNTSGGSTPTDGLLFFAASALVLGVSRRRRRA